MAKAMGGHRLQVSRALDDLGSAIVRLGTRRGARYALRRSVRGIGSTFAIRRIDEAGRAHDWATLTALHGGWQVTWASVAPAWADHVVELGGWSEGFPFFLGDVRPQGHLGRMVGRVLPPTLGLPEDPGNWSDDDTLVYLQATGDDSPGNLIVGDQPLRRVQRRQLEQVADAIPESERTSRYPTLANSALEPGYGGSSVGGEQPKFTAVLGREGYATPVHVIVKFTESLSTPRGCRWADLLTAEAHAHAVLRAPEESVSVVQMLDAGGQRFFEIERFDRRGLHGRIGVVSLRSLYDALPDATEATTWVQAAQQLANAGVIDAAVERSIRLRHTFGVLIGNTDMHFGNLAFFLGDTLPWRLAPLFDMLPMMWAPTTGQPAPPRQFAPPPPLPDEREIWSEAAGWAGEFWQRVADDGTVSAEFRATAREAGALVARMRGRFAI